MNLYFVRHGESTANLLGEFSNNESKHPLTEKGVKQVESVARELSSAKFERICSSPILRARQSAQILSEILHVPVEYTEALREFSVGIYEGTTDPAGWELHRQVYEDWAFRNKFDRRMPEGESFMDIQARFTPFIEGLVRDYHNANRNILLVAHGGLYLAMLPVILRNVSFEFAYRHKFLNTDYAIAESQTDGLHCISWCGIRLKDRCLSV